MNTVTALFSRFTRSFLSVVSGRKTCPVTGIPHVSFAGILVIALAFLFFPASPHAQELASFNKTGFPAVSSSPADYAINNQSLPTSPFLTNDTIDNRNRRKRLAWVTAGNIAFYAGSLLALNAAWYQDYPRSSFHTFDDSREWLQADKVGHAWTAYTTGKYLSEMWQWAGLSRKKAVWVGGLSGAAYLTVIEILDGYSSKWGWSWSDMAANITGSALFMGQEFLWQEQRIQFKFSFHHKTYNDPVLEQRASSLFGKPWYERMLKDYNAQTYWFSANLHSFFRDSKLPAWLNVAVGYGADGMFGGFENSWTDKDGNLVSRNDITRTRQFYLAPDIDFTKIKTRSKFLRTTFSLLNAFKCPAPALMLNSKGKLKAYAIYF